MLRFVCRLAAVAAVALQASACINSDYDLSVSLKPEFPIKPGVYVKDANTSIVVHRLGDAYRVYNRRTNLTAYARLYKIPEYSDYVLQYYDIKKKPIVFLFLKTTDKGFDVYDIDKLAISVPDHLTKLLAPITENDKKDNTITVVNGRRDTLYVVREIARANLKMSVAESYELQTKK
jgi:hypothetical protein